MPEPSNERQAREGYLGDPQMLLYMGLFHSRTVIRFKSQLHVANYRLTPQEISQTIDHLVEQDYLETHKN